MPLVGMLSIMLYGEWSIFVAEPRIRQLSRGLPLGSYSTAPSHAVVASRRHYPL